MIKHLAIATLAVVVYTGSVHAQTPPALSTDASAFVHQITVDRAGAETRYRQVVSPVSFTMPVGNGRLSAQSAFMYVESRDGSGTTDASGPLDTQISGEWTVSRVRVTGYVSVPTGKDSLDAVESALAMGISRNDLDFPVKSFGRGFDYGGAVTIAHQVDQWALSFGGGYVVRGEYAPTAATSGYDPGNELTLTAGVSYATGRWTFGLDGSGKLIYVDRLRGAVIFRNGKQLMAHGSATYDSRLVRLEASVTEIVRLKNRVMQDGVLLYEERDSNGNDLRARGKLNLTPMRGLTLFGEGTFKDVSENAYEPSSPLFRASARLWAYGGGASLRVGREALTLRVMRGDGWLDDRNENVDAWNARLSFRVHF